MRKIYLFLWIFFFCIFVGVWRGSFVFADCGGSLQCYNKVNGVCQLTYHTQACPGNLNQSDCLANQDCECGVMGGGRCAWTQSCVPDWTGCPTACDYAGGWGNSDGCGNYGWCGATGACCTPNCNCAASTCVGQTCRNSCNTADCNGTKANDCGCAANTCVGQTCIGTCGGICNGTKVDESATNCTGTQVQYTETPQTTGTIWAKATGCTWGVTSTVFPTWNSYNGQDDIVWYPGTNQGSGTWQSTLNLSSHQPALGPTVNVHVYENGVCRPVGSGWEAVGGKTVTLAPKTCAVTINTSGAVSSQTSGINVTATGNAHINPGSDTVRVWITRNDMGAIPGGVTYDYGASTGIVAVNNGSNYYSLNSAYQNSVNAANTSAIFTVHAPPGSYRVHCDLPNDLNGNLVKCSGNPTCTINGGSNACAGWKDCSSNDWKPFRINSPPTISNLVIRNSIGTAVAVEAGNRNHICQSSFANTASPNLVTFEVTLTDPDGWSDISSAQLQWKGNTYSLALGAGSGTSRLGTFTANYSGVNDGGVHLISGIVSDPYTNSGWVGLGRSWKVWNCQVPTSGTLYDGSAGRACPTTGFLVPIDGGVGFNSIVFSNTPDVAMSDNNLANYGTDNIVWGKMYHPLINGGTGLNEDGNLLATGRVTRITDLGTGTAQCANSQFTIGSGANAIISAYSASPRAQIDFSFIQDQEAWYQVMGAGVKSRFGLQYGVPVTAPAVSRFLTLGSATSDNGLVSGNPFANTNGNNNNEEFGSPNNWYLEQSTNDLDIYNYNYFYNNFFVKAGVGETKTNSWGGWATDKKIYFVNSNLDINANLTVPNGETIMVIVSGNITINSSVTQLDGIYIADGWISAGGDDTTALTIDGMLYAGGDVKLYRSFTDKTKNNANPAVKVNYSPGLIFNLDPKVLQVLSGWREE